MGEKIVIAILAMLTLTTGCYLPISGRVIDAETNQPIEGAVVLVEWTKTIGYGLTRTESYKVIEVLSDKEGHYDLPGCYSPFVNSPDVLVYKIGYVAWNNKLIFPKYEKRSEYQWRNNDIYKMQKFKSEYSINAHMNFIDDIVLSGNLEQKKLMIKALQLEKEKAFEERRSRNN